MSRHMQFSVPLHRCSDSTAAILNWICWSQLHQLCRLFLEVSAQWLFVYFFRVFTLPQRYEFEAYVLSCICWISNYDVKKRTYFLLFSKLYRLNSVFCTRIAFGKLMKFTIAMATLKPIANSRFHHNTCTQPDSFFTFSSTIVTRGNSRKLNKSHTSSARDGHSFSKRIINMWNSLPNCIVLSKSVYILSGCM